MGVYATGSASVVVRNSVINGNNSTGSIGVDAVGSAHVLVDTSVINDCYTVAISAASTSVVEVTNSTIAYITQGLLDVSGMPANRQDLVVQRVVVRNGFTCDLADMLVRDIRRHLDWFAAQPGFRSTAQGAQFHH